MYICFPMDIFFTYVVMKDEIHCNIIVYYLIDF